MTTRSDTATSTTAVWRRRCCRERPGVVCVCVCGVCAWQASPLLVPAAAHPCASCASGTCAGYSVLLLWICKARAGRHVGRHVCLSCSYQWSHAGLLRIGMRSSHHCLTGRTTLVQPGGGPISLSLYSDRSPQMNRLFQPPFLHLWEAAVACGGPLGQLSPCKQATTGLLVRVLRSGPQYHAQDLLHPSSRPVAGVQYTICR